MGNFLTCYAFMDNNAILMNIAALGILVITIIVNVCIQMVTSAIDCSTWAEEMFVIISMLSLFVALSFSVLTVPTTKRYLELKYDELHKRISNGGKLEETEKFGIVVASKSVLFISIILTHPFFSCCYYGKRLSMNLISIFTGSSIHESAGPETSSAEVDLSDYILQLEGEVKLPTRILKNICHEVQNCWTLPVVNLTGIAFALPNIENHRVARLISSVSEGLSYANLVEESLSTKGDDFLSIKHAADVVWKGIELYDKWLDNDFRKLALEGKTTYEFLQTLGDTAEKTAIEFQRNITGSSKVLVATSMHRICRTISKDYENSTDAHMDENLFEQLSIMIADILGSCLTNLPRVIALNNYCSAVEEREKSVRQAAPRREAACLTLFSLSSTALQ
ncbi:hypothetical protein RHMOL_Rhmol11G0108200 [Rhododendron molle]|uniref:Uncharacterized protein n=1 Tax=Rhododendron molle TaxID=49168 RepID=A0ACC0LR94_RHOML|nr:hypothetical protein RHMOL_Rhmol11G0108200 [Rhododendron molle]